MTSRERVLAAIEHKQGDKVPVDLGATPSSCISAIAYNNLKKHLGITQGQTRIYDVVQQLAEPEDFIIEKFGVDVLDVGRAFNVDSDKWYDVKLVDGSKAQYPKWFRPVKQPDGSWLAYDKEGDLIAKMPSTGTFFDQCEFPYVDGYPANFDDLPKAMSKVMWAIFAPSPWDHAGEEDFWDRLREKCIELRKTTDKALLLGIGCNLFEWGSFLRRMDNFMMDVVADSDNVAKLLDALMESHMAGLEKACKYVGDVVDIIKFGDDLGMDTGPFMSPDSYKELFLPRHKQLCDYVKKNSSMKTMLHSCGGIYKLIPGLIEAGFEILNPVQTSCVDMEPEKLKEEFGNDITFWGGGCDTRDILNRATPKQVKEHVLERLEIFSKDGGFVFNTVHNILPEIEPENIIAMFEAVEEFNTLEG